LSYKQTKVFLLTKNLNLYFNFILDLASYINRANKNYLYVSDVWKIDIWKGNTLLPNLMSVETSITIYVQGLTFE